MYISGIGGFWLNWDRLGQYSTIASAEMNPMRCLWTGAMARNLAVDSVNDRFFSLLIFVHLGVPSLLLFGSGSATDHAACGIAPVGLDPIGVLVTLALLAALCHGDKPGCQQHPRQRWQNSR